MKTKLLAAFLIVKILVGSEAIAQTEGTNRIYTYGVKPDGRICVKISGGGVQMPGVYYIKIGSTLHDLLANDKAEWMKCSNGTFRITRNINGEKVVEVVEHSQWEIKLKDGDDIYAPWIGENAHMSTPYPKSSSTPIQPILNR